MAIRLLSAKLINRIAAGEVVERPASVVKELVENSIDSGADEISVAIEQGGRNLIKVIDNGCGIPQNEIKLSLERHATSKLPTDDLLNITYMGFRGEALPAIASISRFNIISRTKHSDIGWSIKVEGGEIKQNLTPIAAQQGTIIEVRDLFFATPTRLKFLKTEKTETGCIVDMMNKLAMVNPHIKFSLTINEKKTIEYYKCKDYLERLIEIKGKEFAKNVIEVSAEQCGIKIDGYAGLPTYNRANTHYLYLFVNNRAVRDSLLISAVKASYQDFLPHNKYPIVVLYLKVPYKTVDVNVHPTKAEVRFQDKSLVRNILINALRLAINKEGHRTSSEGEKMAMSYFTPEKLHNSNTRPNIPNSLWENTPTPSRKYQIPNITTEKAPLKLEEIQQEKKQRHISEVIKNHPLGNACCQLYNTYILSITDDTVILTDQHAAHERLVYEHLKSNIKIERQSLLIPEMIELTPIELELIMNYEAKFQSIGLTLEKMGDASVIVREIPAILGACNVKELMKDIIDTMVAWGEALSLTEKIGHLYGTFACHTSIRAGRKLNVDEMNSILRQMESTPNSGQCNHGRPTYIKLQKYNLEKLFERR